MTLPSSRPLYALLLTALCCTVLGFNVDVKNCIRYRGPEGSMFGFSVAQHKERGRSWLLIGAPETQTNQPGVEKGGAVFKCGTTREDDCEEVPFDMRGNNNSSRLIQIDSKSRQWFGATVRSSGDNGVILACAPRYVYFSPNGNRKDPVGTCYVTRDFNDFSEYSPCRTRNWGHHKQGTCQAGLGASVSRDGKRLFIGAVGSWYWQGQLYSINSSARLPYLPAIQYIIDDIDEGQFYSQNLYSRPEVLATNEGPPSDDDSYLGYSVAVGSFGYGSESGAAVGMPRGAGLLGKVVLYSTNLTNFYNITGDQLGAYFGYSICVSDVDGDGGDDIIVGAPLYSEFTKDDGSYETGRVYVFLKKDNYRFYERNTRIGFNSKSRFGLALSDLGDINKDGYGDFAVGAPYDGPNELGAVYVYHGTKTGVREKYSQIIRSEDVSGLGRPISTFGFSLSGGTDLDNNLYPDLIIGAYESDVAYFMKSRPVAQMTTSVFFKSDTKQISLERKDCTTKDGTWVPCLFLSTCLQYTGIGVDDQLNIEIQLVLDAKKPKSPRMFFLLEENRNVLNHSMTLEKNVQSCKTFNVYLKNNVRDKLTSLEAELRYRIIEERKFTRTLTPVIDLDNELFAVSRDSISIQKNCGGDNICIPNLRLIATPNSESFLLGSSEKLKVDVIVQNEGEDSFETTFDMTVPPGVNYVKIERIDNNENDIPVQCSAPSAMTNYTLHCDIGNPLPRDKYIRFNVVLEPYQTTETKARYDFQMSVNSTNPENLDSVSDNSKYLGVPLWVETDLIIEGTSKPVDVHYNITMDEVVTDEKQIGPQVIHIYGIRNKGPSDILEAEAYIDWPMFTLAGEPLLYLLEMPETSGQVRCEPIEKINPLKINVDRKRKPYFESSSLVSGGAVTMKGSSETGVSSAGAAGTRAKTFAELTEEEKKVFLAMQKKDEEESKSQWADGSYEQRVRYESSKSESTVVSGNGDVSSSGSVSSSGGVVNEAAGANRGSTFAVGSSESGGSRAGSTTVYATGSSSRGESSGTSGGGSASVSGGGGGRWVEAGSSSSSAGSGATVQSSNTRYGSSSSSSQSQSQSQSQGVYGAYGAAHFDVVAGNTGSGASRFGADVSHFGSDVSSGSRGGTSSSGSRGGTSSSGSRGGTSSSSVNIENESRFGVSTQTQEHGGVSSSSVYGSESSGARGGGSSVVYGGETSGVHGGSVTAHGSSAGGRGGSSVVYGGSSVVYEGESTGVRGGSTAVRGGSTTMHGGSTTVLNGGSSAVYGESSGASVDLQGHHRQQSGASVDSQGHHRQQSSASADSQGHHRQQSGGGWHSSNAAGSEFRSQQEEEERWEYENRGTAAGGQNWNRGGGSGAAGGWQGAGAKNYSTFHESENSRVVNTTWDGRGPSRTYVHDRWRTNDDGLVRNGSSAHVLDDEYDEAENEDGGALDHQGAVRKVTAGGGRAVGGVVSSNVPGDDSDLSVSLHHQTAADRQDAQRQGFRRTQTDETDTVQRWRTVDGKLYKVNKVDDWNALVRSSDDGATTEVYEAQDYQSPQNYAMPPLQRKGAADAAGRQDVDGKFKLYTRFKRDSGVPLTKKCGPTRCATVKCKIGPLSKDQEVWLAFRSRAWVSTLKKVALNRTVVLSSTISAKVTKLPYIGMPESKLAQVRSHEVYTNVIPRDLGAKPDIIPLWIVVLAAVAGTAILLLLVYLLYKCGFFKRNRPSTAPEKQPLTHRNGQAELYQTGDEAL